MGRYSEDTIDKIGNAIIYISERTPSLSKTKLLKLLYLLEEYSATRFGIPFFGIKFETWKNGPVAKEVFIDLSNEFGAIPMLGGHVEIQFSNKGTFIKGKGKFDDSEFSDNDIYVMDHVIELHGHKTADQLILELHKEGTAWDVAARENGLHELFVGGWTNSSDIPVDVTHALSKEARERYLDTYRTWEAMANCKR